MGGERSRFSGRREVAIGLGAYALYMAARHLKMRRDGRARAARNARRIVALERRVGVHAEPTLQRFALRHRRVVAGLNVAYVTLNVGLTVGWLIRLYRRGDPEFPRFRRAALLCTLGAQPVFLFFPVAPPRTLEGFVDTIAEVSGFDLDGLVAEFYDPLAAMPSIHVAYAMVTAAGIAATAQSPWTRRLAPGYPPLVAFIVLVTANHYVADAVGGAALGRLALRLAS